MSTLTALRSNLRLELKVDPSGRVWSDITLDRNIREAVSKIQQDGSFSWFFNDGLYTGNSVIGDGTYDLPSDFARMELRGIKYDGYMLTKRDYREVFDSYNLTQLGNPSIYYIRAAAGVNQFGILAIPQSVKAMSFLYRATVAPMTLDDDDSGMPTDFNEAIQAYAEYLCWSDLTSSPKTQQSLDKYRISLSGLYAQYLGRDDEANFGFSFETITPSAI